MSIRWIPNALIQVCNSTTAARILVRLLFLFVVILSTASPSPPLVVYLARQRQACLVVLWRLFVSATNAIASCTRLLVIWRRLRLIPLSCDCCSLQAECPSWHTMKQWEVNSTACCGSVAVWKKCKKKQTNGWLLFGMIRQFHTVQTSDPPRKVTY